jgi:hypothetical protein
MDSLPCIPTPAAQRWREFRIQILPLIVFICVLVAIAFMWRNFLRPSGEVIQVEAVKSKAMPVSPAEFADDVSIRYAKQQGRGL